MTFTSTHTLLVPQTEHQRYIMLCSFVYKHFSVTVSLTAIRALSIGTAVAIQNVRQNDLADQVKRDNLLKCDACFLKVTKPRMWILQLR